jgi:ribosomal protein S21
MLIIKVKEGEKIERALKRYKLKGKKINTEKRKL